MKMNPNLKIDYKDLDKITSILMKKKEMDSELEIGYKFRTKYGVYNSNKKVAGVGVVIRLGLILGG